MSSTPLGPLAEGLERPRRVRHQARDVVAVMTFSAGTSAAIVAVVLLAGVLLGGGR